MSSTRDVISPGVFAEDASTTIPPTPIAGVSYRDPAAGPISAPDGWPYAERVNSAEFNQLMFQYSTLLGIMDKHGILGWTNLVDYAVPAIVFGSDGKIYTALQASGPSTTPRDPVSQPTYWQEFGVSQATETSAGIAEIATQAEVNTGTDDLRIVTPLKLKSGFAINLSTNGYIKFPSWLGGFIIQWMTVTGVASGGSGWTQSVSLPLIFPTAGLAAFGNYKSNTVIAGGYIVNTQFISTSSLSVSLDAASSSEPGGSQSAFVLAIGS